MTEEKKGGILNDNNTERGNLMKKENISSLVSRFLMPVLLMVLGLVLLFNPDTASALIARLLGLTLVAVGIILGVSAISSPGGQAGKGIASVLFVVVGGWLAGNPLMLAAWIGRLVGILLVIGGLQDISQCRRRGVRFVMPLVTAIVGVVLVVRPMTTSRLVFSLCGLVVLVTGIAMFLDRLKGRNRLEGPGEPEDPNIIDAL